MKNLDIWKEYKQGSPQAKEQLIQKHIGLVKFIVDRIWSGNKFGNFDKEDLTNFGIVGLIEAMNRYDPKVGVKFETFATPRIKGQIIDSIRKDQWFPKDIQKKYRRA